MDKISITYDNNITQIYNIISHKVYEEVILPIEDEIFEIESKDSKQFKKLQNRYNELKAKLKSFGKFCTKDSPIYKTLNTQILELPINQGGNTKVFSFIMQ